MTGDSAEPLLTIRGLTKRYPGVVALKGADFSANAGEVHALVGANGAGKSTLMDLISGAQRPSEGEICIAGTPVQFANPAAAQRAGVATVYQEFSLVPQLSVARNIHLGREPRTRWNLVDERRLLSETGAFLKRYDLRIDPAAEVSTLSVAEQQLVEIARALSVEARILILDEPTAVLSLSEQANLFTIVRELKARGMLILFVSHHLREVLDIADRVSILRDGQLVTTQDTDALDVDALAGLMIGKTGAETGPAPVAADTNIGAGAPFTITYRTGEGESGLTIAPGEIVGLCGLVGAGRSTFAKAVCGHAIIGSTVEVRQDGQPLEISSALKARRSGILYLTEDRKRDGLFANLNIVANTTASALSSFAFGPFRVDRKERAETASMAQNLRLVASSLDVPIATLSGGNQQKVLIARALLAKPSLLICDEPTRGVDVAAKAEIHDILRALAREGVAVLVISSETEELLALAPRIVVMRARRFVADMPAETTDETQLLVAASGGGADAEMTKGDRHAG